MHECLSSPRLALANVGSEAFSSETPYRAEDLDSQFGIAHLENNKFYHFLGSEELTPVLLARCSVSCSIIIKEDDDVSSSPIFGLESRESPYDDRQSSCRRGQPKEEEVSPLPAAALSDVRQDHVVVDCRWRAGGAHDGMAREGPN